MPGKKNLTVFTWLLAASVLAGGLLMSGCVSRPHAKAPEITFRQVWRRDNDVPVIQSVLALDTKIELSRPEDRTVFIEILTDEQYASGRAKRLLTGDDWGGQRFSAPSNSAGVTKFEITNQDYPFKKGQQYWVRSGVSMGERKFGLLVSLVEMPIDKRSGHLFETLQEDGHITRVVSGVSAFEPFHIAK